MANATTLSILFGILNILIYGALAWLRKKRILFRHVLNSFLSGPIPYGILAAFYSGITGKLFLIPSPASCLDDNYRVMLMAAGLSFSWLYYHILFKK
jgi:hypothetical protein